MSDEDLFLELRARGRSVTRTPTSQRKRKHAPPRTPAQRGRSRSRPAQPRQLRFKSGSKDRTMEVKPGQGFMDPVLSAMVSGNNKPYEEAMKRIKANFRKVRHKKARTTLKKMPAGGKPYARRRKSMKKPKGAYRGAVMPRWAKGETKHVLWRDDQAKLTAAAGTTADITAAAETGVHESLDIGDIAAWSLNPIKQGNARNQRNGASVDGTYLRIQGHLHNVSNVDPDAMADAGTQNTVLDGKQRAYVRMLVLAVKGGRGSGTADTAREHRPKANFDDTQLFKKIDGTVVGFVKAASTGNAAARIRTLQLGVNKQQYTLLADRKFELSGAAEGFGASDRLFDMKIPLKQKTTFADGNVDSWEKNQLVFCVMTVDPNMNDSAIDGSDARKSAIQLEFESKYSYKDF